MRRWPEILLTLVLFAAAMAVVSWVVNATVPSAHAWLIDHVGQAGFWLGLGALVIGAALYAWRDHRRAGRNPNGT